MVWSVSNEVVLVLSLFIVSGGVVIGDVDDDELSECEGEVDKNIDDAVVVDDDTIEASGTTESDSVKNLNICLSSIHLHSIFKV